MPLIAASDPDELGGRTFTDDAGQELYFYGPEAEALASSIPRQPDERLASRSALGLSGYAQTPPTSIQPSIVQRTAQGPVAVTGAAQGVAVPQPPAPVPAQYLPGQGAPAPMAPAQPAAPEMVTLPGSAGVNPQRMIERGVMVPTGETVSEAIPVDPELEAVRQGISAEDIAVHQQQAKTQIAKARAQELQAAYQLPELEMRAAEAQHATRQVEQIYEQERADIGAMLDEHRSKKVDPNRYWTSKGDFGGAMTGLSVILGALANGITSIHGQPTGNVALEQVNKEIERDIALQQDEIDREGVNARNSLALLQHRFGDVQQAKDALKLAMHDVADMQAKELMGEFGTTEAAQAYQAWQVAHMREREELERKIRDASKGKQSTQFKFTQPVSGSAARQVPFDQLPLAQQAKIRSQQASIAKSEATIAGGGIDPDVAAKAGAQREQGRAESTKELGKSLAETEQAQSAYNELLGAAGLRFNTDTGKVEGYQDPATGETKDIPGVGLVDKFMPRLAAGGKGRLLRQKLDNALDMLGRARTGAAMPDYEKAAYQDMVLGAGTEEEFINGVEMLQRQINDVRTMHRARFGQPVNRQLEQNRADIERAQGQKSQKRPY